MGATQFTYAKLGLIVLGSLMIASSGAEPAVAETASATAPSTMAAGEDALSLAPPLPVKASASKADAEVSQLAQMDLEGLMNLEITTATLTRTQRHLVPAAITVIDRQDI